MSTRITAPESPHHYVTIADRPDGRIAVRATDNGMTTVAPVNLLRAEFIRAIESELDVIVIDRDGLPEVVESGRLLTAGHPHHYAAADADPEQVKDRALAVLALARHLEANPPVDEAQVDALHRLIGSEADVTNADLARRLVEAGVRVPEAGDDQ